MGEWTDSQERVSKQLMDLGKEALRQGDLVSAHAAMEEANAILDMMRAELDPDDLRLLKLDAQSKNEYGFILQRTDRLDEAIPVHEEAVVLCNKIMEQEEFRANAAASNINLASLKAAKDEFEDARAYNVEAKRLAESLIADAQDLIQANNIAFGANLNLAILAAKQEKWDDADSALSSALEFVPSLREPFPAIDAQAAQGCQQLSVLFFNEEKYDGALKWGKRALEFSEAAHASLGDQVVPIYITSQMNLISFYEKESSFGDAEDCLWKALDVVGNHPQVLERGKFFYESCRKQADGRLEAGNLPRDEVEEGLTEILSRIEEIGGLENAANA